MKKLLTLSVLVLSVASFLAVPAFAELKAGDPAPLFQLKADNGSDFNLESRKGKWTILYFYPKADTPGCTKQACAYRDSVKKFRDLGAEVYGVSSDDVSALVKFKEKHQLNFPLLADPNHEVIDKYGTKMPIIGISKRWTFLIGPELTIRSVDHNVDPVMDAAKFSAKVKELQAKKE
ncbi:peroxiredoxin [bacterium]|jgi:peroxiredoxin Q/BCP|nr:peroxiredoxin [bacterium]